MATSFSNSIRSLKVHDPRKTVIGLIISSVLIIIWLAWFALAQISLYQMSDTMSLTSAEVVVAVFPASASGLIETGQAAVLHLDGRAGADLGTVPGVVLEVKRNQKLDKVEATILIDWNAIDTIDFAAGLSGRFQIEVEKVSPVNLVMRSAKSSVQATPADKQKAATGERTNQN